ncbi:MAG: hypothetical protein ACM3ON_08320 [Chloroflexota bacterium]
MKKIIALVVVFAFVLGLGALGFAETKCDKCHKGDKALDKIVAAKKIDSAAALKKALREGPKAKLHEKLTDEDIAAEAAVLKLK